MRTRRTPINDQYTTNIVIFSLYGVYNTSDLINHLHSYQFSPILASTSSAIFSLKLRGFSMSSFTMDKASSADYYGPSNMSSS